MASQITDRDFQDFVTKVRPNAPQPVADVDWNNIIKTLLAIFEALKGMGLISKWFYTAKVRAVMSKGTPQTKLAGLEDLRAKLKH